MTSKTERNPGFAADDWFIDPHYINCSASRTVAPGLIVSKDGRSAFARQPITQPELLAAWRAKQLCPTAAVNTKGHLTPPDNVFPEEMTHGVYRLGYNAQSSYGGLAWSFEDDDLEGHRDFCWYSWAEQRQSLARLLGYRFEWIFAGHGGSQHLPGEEMQLRLRGLVTRMN